MADFTVEVKHDRLDVRLDKIEPNVLTGLRNAVQTLDAELLDLARANAPVKTGKYRQSIKGSVSSGKKGVIGKVYSDSPLAHIIEGGALIPPHDILPNVAQALHFLGGAGAVFAARVHSPGAKLPGKDVIGGAFEEMKSEIIETLKSAAQSAIGEI